jgi:nitrate reductase NapD
VRILNRRELLSFGSSGSEAAEPDPLIHIASLLVHATPAGCSAVRAAVAAMPNAEIHETGHPNKLAVVLESANSGAVAQAAHELQELAGVVTVSIVAHLTEYASALDQPA